MANYFVYMRKGQRDRTLYIGMTSNVGRDAVIREKQITGWNRAWKIRLIEENSSSRNDLDANLL